MASIELVRDADPPLEGEPICIRKTWVTEKGIKRVVFLWFTEEEAHHLSARLMAFANSQGPSREIIKED